MDFRTCLIADDSRIIRKVARRIVEGLGYEVDEAADGSEALAAGADDYVMKPFDGEILQSKLTEVGAIAA